MKGLIRYCTTPMATALRTIAQLPHGRDGDDVREEAGGAHPPGDVQAVQVRQVHVQQDQFHRAAGGRELRQQPQRGLAVRGGAGQREPVQPAHVGGVGRRCDRARPRRRVRGYRSCCPSASCLVQALGGAAARLRRRCGRRSRQGDMERAPAGLVIVMVPPRRCTACRTRARPRPRPKGPGALVLKPCRKMSSTAAGSMPGPESSTVISRPAASDSTVSSTSFGAGASAAASMALSSRLPRMVTRSWTASPGDGRDPPAVEHRARRRVHAPRPPCP